MGTVSNVLNRPEVVQDDTLFRVRAEMARLGFLRDESAAMAEPAKSGHTVNSKPEKLLTGDVESKVRAAALAKVSGTVERDETN